MTRETPRRDAERARAALGLTLVAYMLLVTAVIVLAPLRFAAEPRLELTWRTTRDDLVMNGLLFLPTGFFLRLATGTTKDRWCALPALFGAATSALLEAAQAWLPGRCPSLLDVATNAAGCWLGALVHDEVRRRVPARAGAAALELPLAGLLSLLVPLVWMNGFAAQGDWDRLWFSLLPGAVGAVVVSAVWVHRLRDGVSAWTATAAAFAWFVVASMPTLRVGKTFVLGAALAVAALVRLLTWFPAFHRAKERRFELPTLRRVAPLYAAYLVLVGTWPWVGPLAPFRWGVRLPEIADVPDMTPMLRLVEWIAVFTVGGYLVAEARGRREEPGWASLLFVLLVGAAASGALEAARGVHPRTFASVLHGLAAVVAAGFGSLVYRRQLAWVRTLRGPTTSSGASSPA